MTKTELFQLSRNIFLYSIVNQKQTKWQKQLKDQNAQSAEGLQVEIKKTT